MSAQALSGLKVMEFAQFVAGPYCGKLLADLGAETIKVESPPTGDMARGRGAFLYLNANKLGITLNPAAPLPTEQRSPLRSESPDLSGQSGQGRRLFSELISTANVLISDKTEREMAQLGLDYASLRELHPRLIITCVTPFGLSGPYRDFKAYYLNVYHASGLGYLTPISQDRGREPTLMGGFAGECACGVSAAVATLAALFWQRISGRGQLIDLSQQEALLSMNRPQAARYPNEGVTPTRADQPVGTGGLMACRDGHVVAIFADGLQWKSLVQLMGNPAWAEPKYEELSYRAVHYTEIKPRIEAWMLQHTREEIYHKGQALGCPVSPVLSPEEMLAFPQFQARDFFVGQEHPQEGKLIFPGAPFRLSATPWRLERPAPVLGQHNPEIYGRLGYSAQTVEELHRQGVI